MLALSGIIFCFAFLIGIIVQTITRSKIPTDQEVDELANRLNRLALKRSNTHDH